MIVGVLTTCHS